MRNVPWRLVLLLMLLVVVTVFAGFNLDRVDVSVGFHVFQGIPLFLALIVSFIAGALLMLPFTLRRSERTRRAEKPKSGPTQEQEGEEKQEHRR
jgi:uncharacterized integral membrane protein